MSSLPFWISTLRSWMSFSRLEITSSVTGWSRSCRSRALRSGELTNSELRGCRDNLLAITAYVLKLSRSPGSMFMWFWFSLLVVASCCPASSYG